MALLVSLGPARGDEPGSPVTCPTQPPMAKSEKLNKLTRPMT
jgi:hypothetical protein